MTAPTPREVFLQLVHGVAKAVSDGDASPLPALYAESTDVSHPMHPARIPPLTSRADLARHFGVGRAGYVPTVRFQPEAIVVHETADPEVIVAEFEYRGEVLATGEPFAVPCVFVMRVRAGLIVESRDYIDHVAFARARGTLGDLLASARPTG
ncbi:MAG TPA: nuclear transport factor 2 family protein [Vitreimonas sp.]|uniref:nuclear transport factor 2 family protein n=1 Tax=Vitreimonas sp. TaxID=3069702 RepID=UPI002D337960|nr:nuclear transport factor 2 family protein [Vitreimonas sp.]HYD87299.1 nuclear transport factor 2 family protein [Vitreimonas sp.]